ncbi:putative glycolipid-binding domain-containing protein [Methylovirgula sp. 4M-Z18]|uniref:putative glycolipid-binding domain-containing protein n=1 Tax=Methylovirgula sp. 4M-Z18 TaxID=2293567 RepID=UPI000E2FD45E|nr:putative glycolipid-binding domain-containing protein [Methylovirgula sp. 4M-Z18]RFB80974.1 transcriptional regulator [Methylovirgula sp. 4M-Z18]
MISARWRSLGDGGRQKVVLTRVAAGWHAVGEVGGVHPLAFDLACDSDWCVRTLIVTLDGGAAVRLTADGKGLWRSEGKPLSHLDGCIDADLVVTPVTNTLPIRRLQLAKGMRREIRVAYITIPDITIYAAPQAYTCLEPDKRYRYESLDHPFAAEFDVDAHGLVRDYPGLFERLDDD